MSSSSSPQKKKYKIYSTGDHSSLNIELMSLKRENESGTSPTKRIKCDQQNEDIQTKKRKNFVTSCEKVSFEAYFDYKTRLHLLDVPSCLKTNICKHNDKNSTSIKVMPDYAEESFKIEMKTNTWCEALDVCSMCITEDQYLSANVLKDIIEIMMNAHEDEYSTNNVEDILHQCQQLLLQNFNMHPPCINKSLRKCYNDFLTAPMDEKSNTFSNRTKFGFDKGIFKYCMSRLEYELSLESQDGPLIDKQANIPEEMKQSVKGLHWQKEKFEIFETLQRVERIKRIMAVLESITLLLQYDLAIWHSRYTNNLGSHIMRSHKPLLAFILWSNNVLYTGAVNNNCRQILRLFIYSVDLQYPEEYIKIMITLLNIMIQTFYICENNSNSDYPNIGKYCTAFANEFYQLISEMPQETIIKVLVQIQPTYMQYLVGKIHLKTLLAAKEDDVIKIFINFIEHKKWEEFSKTGKTISIPKKIIIQPKKIKSLSNFLIKKIKIMHTSKKNKIKDEKFHKFNPNIIDMHEDVSQEHVFSTLYIVLEAFLDAFSVQQVQETLDTLNEKIFQSEGTPEASLTLKSCTYTATEHFIKKYRTIYQMLKELMIRLQEIKSKDELPDSFKLFETIGLLGF